MNSITFVGQVRVNPTLVSSMSRLVCMVYPGIMASSLLSAQLVIHITLYIHIVLGLHTFQHSVGRRKTNFTPHPLIHTYITTPVKFLRPTPSLSSSPISPSPHSFLTTILSLSTIPFHPLLSLPSLTTVPVCQECIQPDTVHSSDYWRLLYRLLEITGDYCRDYWRLL